MAFWDYFFKKKSESASHAVDRIKFVLQSDRTGLPQETLERIKNDIISVLSKYVDIETAELDFNITKAPNENGAMTPALCANIPIKGVKRNTPSLDTAKTEAKSEVKAEVKSEVKTETKAAETVRESPKAEETSKENAVKDSTVKTAEVKVIETAAIKTVSSKSTEDAVKNTVNDKKSDDDGSGLSSALDKTFVLKKD